MVAGSRSTPMAGASEGSTTGAAVALATALGAAEAVFAAAGWPIMPRQYRTPPPTRTTATTKSANRTIIFIGICALDVVDFFRALAELFELVEVDEPLDLVFGALREVQETYAVGEPVGAQVVERDDDLPCHLEGFERRGRHFDAPFALAECGAFGDFFFEKHVRDFVGRQGEPKVDDRIFREIFIAEQT